MDDSLGHSEILQLPVLDSTRTWNIPRVPTGKSGVNSGYITTGTSTLLFPRWDNTYLFWDAITASTLLGALLPSQTGQSGNFLTTDGFGTVSWAACCVPSVFGRTGNVAAMTGDYAFSQISGVATVSQGGTSGTTQPAALKNLTPDTTAQTGKVLTVIPGGGIGWNAGSGSGTVTSVGSGAGLTGGPITATGSLSIANTAVTPGTYTSTNLTVNAQGQITAASNGSGGTPANPTATIGTSAVNGSATTYMRSDGAPAFGNLTGDVTSTGMATTYNNLVPVTKGGTGASTLTLNSVLLGNATSTPLTVAPGASGNVLQSNGTTWISAPDAGALTGLTNKGAAYGTSSTTITTTGAMLNGQILVGSTAGSPALATITGTANQVVVTNGSNSVTLSTPQNINTMSSPTFAALTLTAPLAVANGGTNLSSVGANGTVLTVVTGAPAWAAPALSPWISTFGTLPVTNPYAGNAGVGHLAIGDSAYIGVSIYGVNDSATNLVAIGKSAIVPRNTTDHPGAQGNNNVVVINGVAQAGNQVAINTGKFQWTGKRLNCTNDSIFAGTQQLTGSNSNSLAIGYNSRTGTGSGASGESGIAINGDCGTSSLAINGEAIGEYNIDINAPGHNGDDLCGNGAIRFASGGDMNFHTNTAYSLLGAGTDIYTNGTAINAQGSVISGLGSTIYGSGYGGVGALFQFGGLKANGVGEIWMGHFNTPSQANVGDTNNVTKQHNDVLFGIGGGSTDTTRANVLTLNRDTSGTYWGQTIFVRDSNKINPLAISRPGDNTKFLAGDGTWQVPPGGGGSGTVNSGTAGQMAYYATSTNAVTGNANVTVSSAALTVGVAGTTTGTLNLTGSTSGTVTITPANTAGTYSLTLPAANASGAFINNGSGTVTFATLGATNGGTAQTSYTTGDILYASATNVLSKLPIGSSGNVLTVSAGIPAWQAAGGAAISNWAAESKTSPTFAPSTGTTTNNQLAIGNFAQTTGTNNNTLALGMSLASGTQAVGINNYVVGATNNGAVGDFSFQVEGEGYNTSSATAAVTIGGDDFNGGLTASGTGSTVLNGDNSTASGRSSAIVGGEFETASAQNSGIYVGSKNKVETTAAGIFAGEQANIHQSAADAVILGGNVDTISAAGFGIALASQAICLAGNGLYASSTDQIVGGQWNVIHAGGATGFNAPDIIAVIGNGTSASARSDALTLTGNGLLTLSSGLTTAGHVVTTSIVGAVTTDGTGVTTASAVGSDVAGTVTLTTAINAGGGWAQVTFGTTYGTAPTVVIWPSNAAGASLNLAEGAYITENGSSFRINFAVTNSTTNATYNYIVVH